MRILRSSRRSTTSATATIAVLVLLGACSGGEDAAPTTTTAATITTAAGQREFCGIAEELGSELDQSEDFAAVVAGVGQLAAVAPEGIAGDLKVLVEAYRPLSDVDLESPEGLGRLLELASDPEVAAASGNVDAFVSDECGVELGWNTDAGSDEVARR